MTQLSVAQLRSSYCCHVGITDVRELCAQTYDVLFHENPSSGSKLVRKCRHHKPVFPWKGK